jgi:hypothetical protein
MKSSPMHTERVGERVASIFFYLPQFGYRRLSLKSNGEKVERFHVIYQKSATRWATKILKEEFGYGIKAGGII